jgi:hypothetical protein
MKFMASNFVAYRFQVCMSLVLTGYLVPGCTSRDGQENDSILKTPTSVATTAGKDTATFNFSTTAAAKHLPLDYFEKHVELRDYARWVEAHRTLQSQLVPKRPISDQELFRRYMDLTLPGLEECALRFEQGDIPGARKAFAAYFLKRFAQREPSRRGISNVTSWERKVIGWCEGYLAGRIGPLRASKVFYTLPPGEKFDYRNIDPVGLNNYDWHQLVTWLQPVAHYLDSYSVCGKEEYLHDAVRIINAWYDGFAGQARANTDLLSFDKDGHFRQGNLGHAAIEFTPWTHFAPAEGRPRVWHKLLPFISNVSDSEELIIRMTKIVIEDLILLEKRLPHYWGNFANIIGNETGHLAVRFGFLKQAPHWFQLGYKTAAGNYKTDSFLDGSTKDLTEAYLHSYLIQYLKTQKLVDRFDSRERFPLDKEAFARERVKTFEWLLYTSMPDLSAITFNDTFRPRGVTKESVTEPLRQINWCGRQDLRWLATERAEGTPPKHLSYPFKTHDPSWAGIFTMRSGWDDQAVYLGVDFGPFGGAHGHPDYGSMNVFAYGSDLIVDPACGIYGQPIHQKVDKAPQTHNTIMVDGVGQISGRTEHRPDWFEKPIRSWVTNEVFDAAWGTYVFPNGQEHGRIIWYAKPEYFIVIDTLPGEGVHQVRQNFTLAPFLRPKVEGNSARTYQQDRANILIIPADDRPAPEIIKGKTEPMYEGWVMWDDPGKRVPAPAVVYDFEVEFPAAMETILFPGASGSQNDLRVTRKVAASGEAVLLQIQFGQTTDLFVISRGPGLHSFKEKGIAFDGKVVAIRSIKGEVKSVGLLGATRLQFDDLGVSAERPADADMRLINGKWMVGDGRGKVSITTPGS